MAFNPNIPGYSTQGKSFSRTAAFPLESYEIWTDLEALKAYAANTDASKDPSYIGQKVAYIDTENNRVVHYGIEIDGTLKELGADKMGVEALGKEDEGKIPKAFYVIDSEASGEEGAEDYQPEVGHVEIRWVTPEAFEDTNTVTTVEAADQSVAIIDKAEEGFDGHKYEVSVKIADLGDRHNALQLYTDEQEDLRGGLYVELPDPDTYEIATNTLPEKTTLAGQYYLKKNGKFGTQAINVPGFISVDVINATDEDGNANEHGSFKCYSIKQGTEEVGHITIPKDLVVESGTVEPKTEAGEWGEAGTYIVLKIANQEAPIYINAKDLVDIYTVGNTESVNMTITGTEITADVNISNEEGNIISIKPDGLYAKHDIPSITVDGRDGLSLVAKYYEEDNEYHIEGKVLVSSDEGNILDYDDLGFLYAKAPDLVIPDVEGVTEVEGNYIPVIADLNVNEENKHQIDVSLVNVPVIKDGKIPAALIPDHTIANSVDKTLPEKQEERPVTDKVITALTAKDHTITPTVLEVVTKAGWDKIVGENGVRVLNQEEINKLSALNIESDGSVAISGTINASNVHGLGSEVIDIVTGTGDYVSTPGVGNEGEEGYIAPTIVAKLGVEKGAQVNKIESIALPDRILPILEKEVTIPYATLDGTTYYSGVVRGKEAVNHIVYNEGYGEVYSLSTDKLVNGANELILNGGNAAGATN